MFRHNFEEELEKFGSELAPILSNFEETKHQEASKCLHDCLSVHQERESFVDCMILKRKTIEKQLKIFNARMLFFQDHIYRCFESQKVPYDVCKQEARDLISQYQKNSKRVRTFAMLVKNVDETQRAIRTQSYIDMLESDYYESPNKLAEEELSDHSVQKKKQKVIKVVKKTKNKPAALRKNVNLQKMLRAMPESEFPQFHTISAKSRPSSSRICGICRSLAKYTCPRCLERYCSIECSTTHKEIQCLRIEY